MSNVFRFNVFRTNAYRTEAHLSLFSHGTVFSLIGLDTNKRYQSSTIFSALSDSIQTNITNP